MTTEPTETAVCPGCQHPAHAPGVECEGGVDHGPKHWHRCLCLNRAPSDAPCHPLMGCQGGKLGYSDVWYLQRGHSLSSADGPVTPDVLERKPAASPVPSAALRERIAEAMREHYLCTDRTEADADGNLPCRCGGWREPGAEVDDENDWDSHLADAVLSVLTEPGTQTGGFAAVRPRTLAAIASHVDARSVAILRPDSEVYTEWQAVAAELRRLADEPQPGHGDAHEPLERWRVEILDGEWTADSRTFGARSVAVDRYESGRQNAPKWADGTPVHRRLVRETTTYTVEAEHQPADAPAAGSGQDGAQR